MAISSDTFLVVQETYCFYKKKVKKWTSAKIYMEVSSKLKRKD